MRAGGQVAHGPSGDVRSRDQLEGMITGAADLLGGLDIMITVVGGQVAFVPAVKLHELAD